LLFSWRYVTFRFVSLRCVAKRRVTLANASSTGLEKINQNVPRKEDRRFSLSFSAEQFKTYSGCSRGVSE
jgi:hypothetical protein